MLAASCTGCAGQYSGAYWKADACAEQRDTESLHGPPGSLLETYSRWEPKTFLTPHYSLAQQADPQSLCSLRWKRQDATAAVCLVLKKVDNDNHLKGSQSEKNGNTL